MSFLCCTAYVALWHIATVRECLLYVGSWGGIAEMLQTGPMQRSGPNLVIRRPNLL